MLETLSIKNTLLSLPATQKYIYTHYSHPSPPNKVVLLYKYLYDSNLHAE